MSSFGSRETAGGVHACAPLSGSGVRCWGSNADGRLGSGTGETISPSPVPVSGLDSSVVAISAAAPTVAIDSDRVAEELATRFGIREAESRSRLSCRLSSAADDY